MNAEFPYRPKICHLICDGSKMGGGNTLSLAYFPRYSADFETWAIVDDVGDLAEKLQERGVRTRSLPLDRPWKTFLSWPRLWAMWIRERPAAVILHGQGAGFFGAIAARLAGVRTILYYTHFPFFYTDWDFYRIVRNHLLEATTCALATQVICPSAGNRYQYLIRRMAPDERILSIPNGLDPVRLSSSLDPVALRQELDFPADEEGPVAVSVSRLSDQKRIDWLVRAWKMVEDRLPTGVLLIVGSGPEEAKLRALAIKLGLQRCRFLGARPDAFRYYLEADLGISCSLYEAQPMTLIEAMFCGCPMIGCAVDGIADTIEPGVTGLLVPPADPPALAAAIIELLRDPARAAQMAEQGRERAKKLYHLDIVIRKQLDTLHQALRAEAKVAGLA